MVVEKKKNQAIETNRITELESLAEEILANPQNRLIQTSRENINNIIEQVMVRIASQKEKMPSYQRSLDHLKRIASHLLGFELKEPQKQTAVTIDCAYLLSNVKDPNDLRIRVLIAIAEKFSGNPSVLEQIIPKEVDSALELVVRKALENLKLKNGISSQILFVKNLDLLNENSQALIVKLLFKDLAGPSSALTVNILHEESIATYVYKEISGIGIGFEGKEEENFERKTL